MAAGIVLKKISCPKCKYKCARDMGNTPSGKHFYKCFSCGEVFQREYGKQKKGENHGEV